MKIGRKKQIKRIMKFYRINYGFEEPYRLLIDGTFILASLKNKIHIKEQISKMLNGKITPIITDCIFKELDMLNKFDNNEVDFSGAKLIARGYFRHKCGHIYKTEEINNNKSILFDNNKNDLQESKDNLMEKTCKFDSFRCILDVISKNNNLKKFIVATQDTLLRKKLHKIPGVPLLYLNNQTPILEQPSLSSNYQKSVSEENKLAPQKWEYSLIPSLKKSLQDKEDNKAKRRKKKNPNPLSCLKKKSKPKIPKKVTDDNIIKKKRVRTKRKKSQDTISK